MDSKIIVREAKREECEAVYDMIREMIGGWKPGKVAPGSGEALEKLIFDQKAACLAVALYDGELAGYTFYNYNASSLNCMRSIAIDNLFVRVAYRRKGVGTALFQYLQQKTLDEGILGVKVFSPALNGVDTAFYTAMGLAPSDTRLSYTWNNKNEPKAK